jgi:hypothetical protein
MDLLAQREFHEIERFVDCGCYVCCVHVVGLRVEWRVTTVIVDGESK